MKYNRKISFFLLTFLSLLLPFRVRAACPTDLAKHPMTCSSILSSDVEIYADASCEEVAAYVDGNGLTFKVKDASKDSMVWYGNYSNKETGENGKGWIKASAFVYDTDYQATYETVRAKMSIYSSSSLSHYKNSIPKYSGIITIGKKNNAYQVIYETKKGYGIGWMSLEEHANTLDYDGREKQVLADGAYTFARESGREVEVTLDYQGRYYIRDLAGGSYMTMRIETASKENPDLEEEKMGLLDWIKYLLVPSFRQEKEAARESLAKEKAAREERESLLAAGVIYEDKEKNVTYQIVWTEEKPKKGEWRLEREEDGYAIGYKKTSLYALLGEKDCLGEEALSHRVSTKQAVLDKKHPMVFTQYDPAWCGKAYGSEGCIGTAGCGILATVNAVYALSGQYLDVMDLADYAVEKGYRIIGNGTAEGIFKACAKKYGQQYDFAWDGSDDRISILKKKLKKGDTAVAHVIGHYVAIVAYNEKKNTFLLLDSNCLPKRATSAFGDWISQSRLESGYLYGQNYYFFRLGGEEW